MGADLVKIKQEEESDKEECHSESEEEESHEEKEIDAEGHTLLRKKRFTSIYNKPQWQEHAARTESQIVTLFHGDPEKRLKLVRAYTLPTRVIRKNRSLPRAKSHLIVLPEETAYIVEVKRELL